MPKRLLDNKDYELLGLLQQDGRMANTELAERVALSPSPCLRRVQRLEREGTIRGYRAEIDRNDVGLGLTIFVGIKVQGHSRKKAEKLSAALSEIDEVISCYMVSGESDFLAEVVVRDLVAYEQLLTNKLLALPMIADIKSNFALRTIKENKPLPIKK